LGQVSVINEGLDAAHIPGGGDMSNYGALHDRVVLGFEFDWQNGAAIFKLSRGDLIEFRGVMLLNISRKLPWGPSNTILETKATVVDSKLSNFIIVMQSGDEISIIADEVVLPDGAHQCFPSAISTEAP
jgi:hypothetical protein